VIAGTGSVDKKNRRVLIQDAPILWCYLMGSLGRGVFQDVRSGQVIPSLGIFWSAPVRSLMMQPDSPSLDGSLAVAIFSDTGALTGEFVFPQER